MRVIVVADVTGGVTVVTGVSVFASVMFHLSGFPYFRSALTSAGVTKSPVLFAHELRS